MTYKLKLNKTIAPKKSKLQEWADPVGWWKVTTEGDCEGRTTNQLGTHYGHVVEIAMSLPSGPSYSYRFEKATKMAGIAGDPDEFHTERQAVRKEANISLDPISYKGGEKEIAKWLDCDEIEVKPCNYYGAYTIKLKA